jgi:hypothetical protein
MSQNWTICVRYTAHPGMIAAAPYSAGRIAAQAQRHFL